MPGYNVTPLEPPEPGLLCLECRLFLRDPIQTDGGDRLCRSCYDMIKRTGVSAGDLILGDDEMCRPDRAAEREVLQLRVKCPGCSWKGELKLLEVHCCSPEGDSDSRGGFQSFSGVMESRPSDLVQSERPTVLSAQAQEWDHQIENIQQQLSRFNRSVSQALANFQRLYRYINFELQKEKLGQVQGQVVTPKGQPGSGMVLDSRLLAVEKKVNDLERQNAMLKVHVSELELQLQASLASTHNGSFLWRIPDVGRRRRDAVEERTISLYSPPFYTGRNGYKMCIRAYLNGDGIGFKTHLSLFFVLMQGEYDPLLKWPFEHKVSLILVDQDHRKHIVQTFKPTPESSSFKCPTSDITMASGCPQFSKVDVLDEKNYVKDDIMYIKCIVDTSDIFHP